MFRILKIVFSYIFIYFLIFIYTANAQFKSDTSLENIFSKNIMENISFTNDYIWAGGFEGLIRISNENIVYYLLDTNSTGELSDYIWDGNLSGYMPNTEIPKLNYNFELLQSNTEFIWINYKYSNKLLKLFNNNITRYQFTNKKERLTNSLIGKKYSYFQSSFYTPGDSCINNIYSDNGNKFILDFSFKTKYPLRQNSLFLFNGELFFSESDDNNHTNNHYFNIYKIDSSGKKLFLSFPDDNYQILGAKIISDNSKFYFMKLNGKLFIVDNNKNIDSTKIKLGRIKLHRDCFYIINNNLLYCVNDTLKYLDMDSLNEYSFKAVPNDDTQHYYIDKFFISNDNYIYCLIACGTTYYNSIGDCMWKKLKLIQIKL